LGGLWSGSGLDWLTIDELTKSLLLISATADLFVITIDELTKSLLLSVIVIMGPVSSVMERYRA
jgi:hypothetical protein